jgi:hypothetical protein
MAFFNSSRGSSRSANNSWRSQNRSQILMVSSRSSPGSKDRAYKIGALILLMLALAGGAWAAVIGLNQIGRWLFSENDRFTVHTLDIKSTGRLPATHIQEYGHLVEGMNLFSVNLDRVRKDLESVPLIKSANVQRVLPGTLSVRVTERTALARLGADDRINHFAVDRDGYVLGPSSRTSGMPAITGLREFGITPGSQVTNAVLADALLLVETCDTLGLGPIVRIATIDVGHDDYLEVRLAGGERAWLSRTDVRLKLEWLATSLQKAEVMGKSIQFIDLTMDKNPPVQYAER